MRIPPFVCPHCAKSVDELPIQGLFSAGLKGLTYSCPHCSASITREQMNKLQMEEISRNKSADPSTQVTGSPPKRSLMIFDPPLKSPAARRRAYWAIRAIGALMLLFWVSMCFGDAPPHMSADQYARHRLVAVRMTIFSLIFFPFFGGLSSQQYATKSWNLLNRIIATLSFWVAILHLFASGAFLR